MEPLQQTPAAMSLDFDAVFGNKATPTTNGHQPAAGKAGPVQAGDALFGFAGGTELTKLLTA